MNKNNIGKRFGYFRVSDNEQHEDLQLDALQKASCDAIYGDHGVSGVVRRKGLEKLLKELKKGDTLVIWKLDRLGRTTIQLLLLIEEFKKQGIHLMSLTQNIDTSTPEGRLAVTQLASFAEYERGIISVRTKAGMAAAKRRGIHLGRSKKLSLDEIAHADRMIRLRGKTKVSTAKFFNVSTVTLWRCLKIYRAGEYF
ncbi:MAG: recombinase family protein [Rhizobiales bacterium]|nr:recombinase family protein [Hyphomicrobiales bacterium]